MDDVTFEALEYPAVLREFEGFAETAAGRELIRGLRPSGDALQITEGYRELKEAILLLNRHGGPPLFDIYDIGGLLTGLKKGAYMLPDELLKIKKTIGCLLSLKKFPKDLSLKSNSFPIITEKMDSISAPASLHQRLTGVLDDRGGIKDDATGNLLKIRNSIASSREKSRIIIEEMVKDRSLKASLQDELFTIRDDRFALCIKASHHAHFPGVILDRSSSGATYFFEPFRIVEINNRITILKEEEKEEELEILKEVSLLLFMEKEGLLNDLATAAWLDFVFAKARFKSHIKGVIPEVKGDGGVKFTGARHPLLVFKERKGGGSVTPVDLVMDEAKKILVISGANTGGKTVALKTMGLLSLMAHSSLPVPAEEAGIAVFGKIFACIGDRQDIRDNLSTFSAHIKRLSLIIGEIIKAPEQKTLVCIDEIGAGTNPEEASVLSLAILEALKEKGAYVAVTTHLALLKAHAQSDASFENVSVEFDEKTLKPLYTLRYGLPGKSMGLNIAGSYGMPHDIIERAKNRLKAGGCASVEGLFKMEEEIGKIKDLRERLSKIEEKRQNALARIRDERNTLLENARRKVESIVEKAESRIRTLVESARASIPSIHDIQEIKKVKERVLPLLDPERINYRPVAGDFAEITGSGKSGVILRVDEAKKTCEVLIGNIKVLVSLKRLKKAKTNGNGEKRKVYQELQAPYATTLNLKGMRAEAAIKEVERFVDTAHSSGIETVELVHGIGTGALMKALHEYLGGNPLVKGFRCKDPLLGKVGVTVVEIK